jgi:ADP-ribose pyrophosphatase YjhB (NUDIX family)
MTGPKLGVSGILRGPGRTVLLGRRGQGGSYRDTWAFPGGTVEYQESLVAALQREFFEETQIAIRVGSLADWVEVIQPPIHFVILAFFVYPAQPLPRAPQAASDLAELAWLTEDEALSKTLAPGMRECLSNDTVRRHLHWLRRQP